MMHNTIAYKYEIDNKLKILNFVHVNMPEKTFLFHLMYQTYFIHTFGALYTCYTTILSITLVHLIFILFNHLLASRPFCPVTM